MNAEDVGLGCRLVGFRVLGFRVEGATTNSTAKLDIKHFARDSKGLGDLGSCRMFSINCRSLNSTLNPKPIPSAPASKSKGRGYWAMWCILEALTAQGACRPKPHITCYTLSPKTLNPKTPNPK